jgi:hypothetical protein
MENKKENKEKAQRCFDLAREIDPYDDNLEDQILFQTKVRGGPERRP